MDKEEVKKLLRENLDVKVHMKYDASGVDVDIYFDGEKIASGHGSKYSGIGGPR